MSHVPTPSASPPAASTATSEPPPPERAPGAPRLEVDGLTVAFGGLTALDDVTLAVGEGETLALIGPNGAGKTTVFNAVCGLVRPTSGTVRIDGTPAPTSPVRLLDHGLARTLQGLGLFDGMTVLENILVPLTGRSTGPRRSRKNDEDVGAAREVLSRLDLTAAATRPVDALPYPERKRVALARALVTRPRLLLLDEPAGGLGAADVAQLADLVREVRGSGTAVLLVEHHVDFVMEVADRVVVLDLGRVVAAGTPDEVRADPEVEATYLGLEVAR